jgi:hypothetical protein
VAAGLRGATRLHGVGYRRLCYEASPVEGIVLLEAAPPCRAPPGLRTCLFAVRGLRGKVSGEVGSYVLAHTGAGRHQVHEVREFHCEYLPRFLYIARLG